MSILRCRRLKGVDLRLQRLVPHSSQHIAYDKATSTPTSTQIAHKRTFSETSLSLGTFLNPVHAGANGKFVFQTPFLRFFIKIT